MDGCSLRCKALYGPLQVLGENESFFFASGISNLLDLLIHLGAVLIIWKEFFCLKYLKSPALET